MEQQDKKIKPRIKQHKDLADPRYRHKVEAGYKIRLLRQEVREHKAEIKEFVNGDEHR